MSSQQPVRLKGRDLEILYRHLAGQTNKEIALDLGLSEGTISGKVNSDWFRNELALIHARTVTNITAGQYSPIAIARAHALEAMNKNIEQMRFAKDERVQQRAAWDILDRSGNKAPNRVETLNINDLFDQMTAEELEDYATNGKIPDRLVDNKNQNQQLLPVGTNTVQ